MAPRLLARDLFQTVFKPRFAHSSPAPWTRAISGLSGSPNSSKPNALDKISRAILSSSNEDFGSNALDGFGDEISSNFGQSEEPYHFHIYSTKHNTHVTVTKPNRDAIISLSCGNLGFKKSNRGSYDSAYQLGAYAIDKLHQMGVVKTIHKLEVVLRGFGPGREAVTKVLLGNEGKLLRGKIIRVSDSTRLKFGGTRSPKPRRLG